MPRVADMTDGVERGMLAAATHDDDLNRLLERAIDRVERGCPRRV